MKGFSPTSLALTFHHLRDKQDKKLLTLEESLAEEQRMQQRCGDLCFCFFYKFICRWKSRCFTGTFSRCLAAPDFKEGIRCHLLGKDKGLKPLWNPATLKQVKLVEEFVVESFN